MAKSRHYSPKISRFLVSVLYHEAKRQKIPMTKLADTLLEGAVVNSESWHKARVSLIQESAATYSIRH